MKNLLGNVAPLYFLARMLCSHEWPLIISSTPHTFSSPYRNNIFTWRMKILEYIRIILQNWEHHLPYSILKMWEKHKHQQKNLTWIAFSAKIIRSKDCMVIIWISRACIIFIIPAIAREMLKNFDGFFSLMIARFI